MQFRKPSGPSPWKTSPVTFGILTLLAIGLLLAWGSAGKLTAPLMFVGLEPWKVYTWFTYPYTVFMTPFSALFLGLWLYQIGTVTESEHGSKNFLLVWLGVCLISVLPLILVKASAEGSFLPVAALTVMWATRRPESTLMLFGLVPIKAKWIGVISALTVFFNYASAGSQFYIGIVALVGCLISFLYAANKITNVRYGFGYGSYVKPKPTKAQKKKEEAYLGNVYEREKEREERERLRKLFESSLDESNGEDRK
jgi:membrane associated rhomboid family serine protease